MLKLEDFTREFPIKDKTDRDVEIPVLLEFVQKIIPIESLLDIGAMSTDKTYASMIRPFIKRYDGIDIVNDENVRKIVDNYYVGNANTYLLDKYDVVVCLSTIEHAGISTYKGDYQKERDALFRKCLELSNRYVWISFPAGQEHLYLDQMAVIPYEVFENWKALLFDYHVTQRFFYSQGPQAGHPWYEHNNKEVAFKIPFIDFIGNQSICVLEIEK